MKRILIIATLIIINTTYFIAQNESKEFVKFNENKSFRNGAIKIFEGDILPYTNNKANSIDIIVNKDTVTEVPKKNIKVELITQKQLEDYTHLKNSFLKKRNDNYLVLDCSSINSEETVKVLNEKGEVIVTLISQRTATIDPKDAGQQCRLIFSNSPTLFYDTNELEKYKELTPPTNTSNTTSTASNTNNTTDTQIPWGALGLGIALGIAVSFLCLIAFAFMKRKRKPANKQSETIRYNGETPLDKIAEAYNLTEEDLVKLNKNILDSKYSTFTAHEKAKIRKKLKGKELIIGYKTEDKTTNEQESGSAPQQTAQAQESKYNTNTIKSQKQQTLSSSTSQAQSMSMSQKDRDFIQDQLNDLKNSIANKIEAAIKNDFSEEKTHLMNQINTLTTNKEELQKEIEIKDTIIQTLRQDKNALETEIETKTRENQQLAKEITQTNKKIISVTSLQEYASRVHSYLKDCQKITNKIYDLHKKINQQVTTQVTGELIINFQEKVNTLAPDKWMQITEEIAKTGVTTNSDLIRSFSQLGTEEEKQREFRRILFAEILVKYSNYILIITEAYRNLSRFDQALQITASEQESFMSDINELTNRAKTLDIEIRYVPLFRDFNEYLTQQIEATDNDPAPIYQQISGLQKNEIVQIISYGVKTEFEDSKTYLILK